MAHVRTKNATGNGKTRSKARSVAWIWTEMSEPENERRRRDDGDVAHAAERREAVEEREQDRLEARADRAAAGGRRSGLTKRSVRSGFAARNARKREADQRAGADDDRRAAEQQEPAGRVARHLAAPSRARRRRRATTHVTRSMRRSRAIEAMHGATGRPAVLREGHRAHDLAGARRKERRGREADRGRGVQVPGTLGRARPCGGETPSATTGRAASRARPHAVARTSQPTCAAADRPADGREIERPQEQDEEKRGETERDRDAESPVLRGHASMVAHGWSTFGTCAPSRCISIP